MKEYWILKKIKEDCLHDKVDVESIRKKAEKEIIQVEKKLQSVMTLEDEETISKTEKDKLEKYSLLKKICTCVKDRNCYYDDIDIALLMFFGIEETGSSKIKGEVEITYSNLHGMYYEDEESPGNRKGDMGRYSKDIEKYFPFAIIENKKGKFITEWCKNYQELLWGKNNAEIFSINKQGNDISRYCYLKTEKLYDSLKEKSIENLLMFEMTLGFGVTNTIYSYLENIKKVSQILEIEPVLQILCELPGINLRKTIADLIFCYLSEKEPLKDYIKIAVEALKDIQKNINELYKNILRLGRVE